jgi:hypothetical protein
VKEEGIADEAVLFDKVVSLFLLNISFSAWTLLLISWELLLQMQRVLYSEKRLMLDSKQSVIIL